MNNQAGKMTGVQEYTQMFTIFFSNQMKSIYLTGWLHLQVFPTPLYDSHTIINPKHSWFVKQAMEMKNGMFTPVCIECD